MNAGSSVGLKLMRSFVYLQVPSQACPLVRGDAGEPIVITSTLSLRPAAIQFGGSVDHVPQTSEQAHDGSGDDVLVSVELRGRGPGGRGRRFGRLRC